MRNRLHEVYVRIAEEINLDHRLIKIALAVVLLLVPALTILNVVQWSQRESQQSAIKVLRVKEAGDARYIAAQKSAKKTAAKVAVKTSEDNCDTAIYATDRANLIVSNLKGTLLDLAAVVTNAGAAHTLRVRATRFEPFPNPKCTPTPKPKEGTK